MYLFFFFNDTATTEIYTLSLHDALPISIENPRAYVQSNLVGHLNLMEIARHRGSSHLVYASSSSVYGGNETLPFRVEDRDRKSTRLNSSHANISYAVFCLKKKTHKHHTN